LSISRDLQRFRDMFSTPHDNPQPMNSDGQLLHVRKPHPNTGFREYTAKYGISKKILHSKKTKTA
jgi:hypothetical protein